MSYNLELYQIYKFKLIHLELIRVIFFFYFFFLSQAVKSHKRKAASLLKEESSNKRVEVEMKPEEIEDFIVHDGNEVPTDDIPMCKDWKTWMNLWITWVSSEGANNRLSYMYL